MQKISSFFNLSFVIENNFVESSKSRYFAAWVQKFLKLNIAERLSNNDKIRQFRDYLDVDENLNDWLRNQGQKVIEIYLNMYLKGITDAPFAEEHPELVYWVTVKSPLRGY